MDQEIQQLSFCRFSMEEDNLNRFSMDEDNYYNTLPENHTDSFTMMSQEEIDGFFGTAAQQSTPSTSVIDTNYCSSQHSAPTTSIQSSSGINSHNLSMHQSTSTTSIQNVIN
jgi:hypothetical protein